MTTRYEHDDLYWQDEYEPITEDDAFLREIVAASDLPSLLAALAAVTGDTSALTDDLQPPLTPVDTIGHPHGGMTAEQQEKARAIALAGLRRVRDERLTSVGTLSEAQLGAILGFLVAGHEEWIPSLTHELDLAPDKGAAPDWHVDEFDTERPFTVLVIGAGMSGIAAGFRFSQAGIPVTMIDEAHTLGGTWWKNRYPGVRLDTPTFGYSFSFAQRADWPHQFAEGAEIEEYLLDIAQRTGLADRVEFSTRFVRAAWLEEEQLWEVTTSGPQGERTRRFSAIITAVGQLDRPHIPDFPGRDSFRGVVMHSAEWDDAVAWQGKRVAVIGTGASAYQIVPAMYRDVESLVVFQRSAPWMLPAPSYHAEVTEAFAWLVRKLPHFGQWYRLWVTLLGIPGRLHTVTAEEGWPGVPVTISAVNQRVRDDLIARMTEQYADRPELLSIAIPSYPPGAKRMLRDNGVWAAALKAPTTTVETSPISHLTERGIVTESGIEHEVDIIVYATGFKASDYLDGMEFVGRDGIEIHEYWRGDARAYNGITVPGFPNLFMLYGPNIVGVVSGSLHFMIERSVEYALKAVRELLASGAHALEVTQEALERYLAWVDPQNRRMSWGQPFVHTWYQNAMGRVSQIWPFTNAEFWEVTERVDLADYEVLRSGARAGQTGSMGTDTGANASGNQSDSAQTWDEVDSGQSDDIENSLTAQGTSDRETTREISRDEAVEAAERARIKRSGGTV
ncbi:flavin-containing monooxygenase [Lysinimonas soli]|uniref:Flavin-containing monooxygenase n=1 Tax=Lysinimonas soli TaxID=1074233 RepID=A0ABW0NT99_9MICO